jgi:hypothetical protein
MVGEQLLTGVAVMAGKRRSLLVASWVLSVAAASAAYGAGGGSAAHASGSPVSAAQRAPAAHTAQDVVDALTAAGVSLCRDPGIRGPDLAGATDHGYWTYDAHPQPDPAGGPGSYRCAPNNAGQDAGGVDVRVYHSATAAKGAADQFSSNGGSSARARTTLLWSNVGIYETDPVSSPSAAAADHVLGQLPGIVHWRQTGPAGATSASQQVVVAVPTPSATSRPSANAGAAPSASGSTTSPAGVWMPTAPFYATFYYPWYQNPAVDGTWGHWQGEETPGYFHHAPSNWNSHYLPDTKPGTFEPSTELYSSADVNTVYWQLGQMKAAHQTVAIASWWGQHDSFGTDANFRRIITDYMNRPNNPYPTMRWALYYEMEGQGDPSVQQIDSDLNYIRANYASQPGYLWVNGKPVIFVYNTYDGEPGYPLNDLVRWEQARADTGFYVNMKIQPVSDGGANPDTMDGWHEYGPSVRGATYRGLYYLISPGFWREQETPRLSRDPNAFAGAAQAMAAANVPWKLTETWNEWIEGTAVEPGTNANWQYDTSPTTPSPNIATQNGTGYGSTYVDILGSTLPRPPPAPPLPTAPQGLRATAGDSAVALSWSPPSNVSPGTTYDVYRSTIPGGERSSGAPPIAKGLRNTHFTDTGLTNGRPYYYVVTGVSSVPREGAASSEATATPGLCTTYTSRYTGSHQVCGAIRQKYQELGGPTGFLGYPITDELATPDGRGRYNHFANSGSIYWTRSTGAWSVHGAIQAKWASLGWERSCLGYPISDEYGIKGGRQSRFQNGTISYIFTTRRTVVSCR